MSKSTYNFWNNAAAFFGEYDVEGFIGIALLVSSALITVIAHPIIIMVVERKLLNKHN